MVELGHLGMIPACCLGLVAGGGQKETDWSEAETLSESLGSLRLLFLYTADSNRRPETVFGVVYKSSYQIQVIFPNTFAKLAYEKGERHFSIHM